jgi:hypothetical protein
VEKIIPETLRGIEYQVFTPVWFGRKTLRVYKHSEGLSAIIFKSNSHKLHLAILDIDSNILVDQPYATVSGLFRSMEEFSVTGCWKLVISSFGGD